MAETDIEPVTVAIVTAGRKSLLGTLQAIRDGIGATPDEILLVDNSDGSMNYADVAMAIGSTLFQILPGNSHQGGGRNRLIENARNDIICFTDDDCVPAEDWLHEMARFMSAHPGVAAGFGMVKPLPLAGARVVSVSIAGVGVVAWGSAESGDEELWCPSISAPEWPGGIIEGEATVPWARLGASNSLALRRSKLLPGRPAFLPTLGPGTPAASGEDTELGYALMAAGRPVAYIPDAVTWHDSWINRERAEEKRRSYFRGNTEALGHHALRGDQRANELLMKYWSHFCLVNNFPGLGEVLRWAYDPQHLQAAPAFTPHEMPGA